MLDPMSLDLDEVAIALTDQPDYEHRWLVNPRTGEVVFWSSDAAIDGAASPRSSPAGRRPPSSAPYAAVEALGDSLRIVADLGGRELTIID